MPLALLHSGIAKPLGEGTIRESQARRQAARGIRATAGPREGHNRQVARNAAQYPQLLAARNAALPDPEEHDDAEDKAHHQAQQHVSLRALGNLIHDAV